MTRHPLFALALVGLGSITLNVQAAPADIEVMNQNQYLGFDLLNITGGPGFDQSVIDGLMTRAASLPKERTVAMAKLISSRMPALVALEEAYEFTCVDAQASAPDEGCNDPEIAGAFTDQLDDTLAALGGKYYRAAEVINFDLPRSIPQLAGAPGIPVNYKGRQIFIGVLDRDVILARKDVATAPLPFQAFCERPSEFSEGCNYSFVAQKELAILGTTIVLKVERGFVGVTATVGGQPYKFIATHLETRFESQGTYARIYQSGQSAELLMNLQAIAAMPGRMLVAGDFNSDPRDQPFTLPQPLIDQLLGAGVPSVIIPYLGVPPYMQLTASGFTDVWTLRPGAMTGKGAPLVGFSCCQDADLANQKSVLYERVDLIWSLSKPSKVQDARLLGASISDKTQPIRLGVWPSDHASVAAKLTFGK